ncbi:hypothetical protein CPB85DRAFT_1430457 [Mucidula mucida]|nr:hypothetical protein CPB85DRAFT_1430457 [Mucidula mucida]
MDRTMMRTMMMGSGKGSKNNNNFNPSTSGDFFCKFCVPDNDARILYDGLWSLNGAGTFKRRTVQGVPARCVSEFQRERHRRIRDRPFSDSTSKPPTASFTLDAHPPFVTTQASADRPVANQPLFASPKLSEEEHQIVINITSVDARSPFTLDYFLIFPNPNGISTEATVSFSGPPSATTPWPSAIAVTDTGTSTSKPQAAAAGMESLQNVVKILSVLMGVLVFLVISLIVFIVWYIRKSRVRRARSRPRSFRSRISRQGTVLTSPESIMRNFTSSMAWSSAGSAAPLSPALPPLPEKEARSL